MWSIGEEIQQFNGDCEYRHDVGKELNIYKALKELYMRKLNYKAKLETKRGAVMEFGQEFNKLAQDPELLLKLQMKTFGESEWYKTH